MKIKTDMYHNIAFLASIVLIIIGLAGFTDTVHAAPVESTYYNQYGSTAVGNTYNNDTGEVTSTYYNQYGNTVVGNAYDNQSNSDVAE